MITELRFGETERGRLEMAQYVTAGEALLRGSRLAALSETSEAVVGESGSDQKPETILFAGRTIQNMRYTAQPHMINDR